jgi:hypothetical protein
MLKFITDLLTARNGMDYSLTKLVGVAAVVTMIVKFWQIDTPDFVGFGMGVGALMGALAAKYYVEQPAKELEKEKEE